MDAAVNTINQGDCIEGMANLRAGSVDLAFADPPFNIGYNYDVYDDRRAAEDYLNWSRDWIVGVHRVLKPDGTFWLAIGDEFAAELKLIAQRDVGFHCRSWVIWYYTFGVNCTRKFTRSHAHLFHFVKDSKKFTFNADDPAIRIPSARQLVYADARANPKGRLPDDTWILRPQDLPEGFTAESDVWYFSRVAGTFKERVGFHGCQMPERLLGRIVSACSNPGDTVLDPFAGSGSTLVVAKKLGREPIGFELSEDYASRILERLNAVKNGDELDGAKDPLRSAPSTVAGKRLKDNAAETASVAFETRRLVKNGSASIAKAAHELRKRGIIEAFQMASGGFSVDRLVADPELNANFIRHCYQFGFAGDPASWNRQLMSLRKSAMLAGHSAKRTFNLSHEEMDDFAFASEIAWHDLSEEGWSLDDILCDPSLAARFDDHARRLAPGHSSLQYRWAALGVRKSASRARTLASKRDWAMPRARQFGDIQIDRLADLTGVYILKSAGRESLYVGDAFDVAKHLNRYQAAVESNVWSGMIPHYVNFLELPPNEIRPAKAFFVDKLQSEPLLNVIAV